MSHRLLDNCIEILLFNKKINFFEMKYFLKKLFDKLILLN